LADGADREVGEVPVGHLRPPVVAVDELRDLADAPAGRAVGVPGPFGLDHQRSAPEGIDVDTGAYCSAGATSRTRPPPHRSGPTRCRRRRSRTGGWSRCRPAAPRSRRHGRRSGLPALIPLRPVGRVRPDHQMPATVVHREDLEQAVVGQRGRDRVQGSSGGQLLTGQGKPVPQVVLLTATWLRTNGNPVRAPDLPIPTMVIRPSKAASAATARIGGPVSCRTAPTRSRVDGAGRVLGYDGSPPHRSWCRSSPATVGVTRQRDRRQSQIIEHLPARPLALPPLVCRLTYTLPCASRRPRPPRPSRRAPRAPAWEPNDACHTRIGRSAALAAEDHPST